MDCFSAAGVDFGRVEPVTKQPKTIFNPLQLQGNPYLSQQQTQDIYKVKMDYANNRVAFAVPSA